MSAQAERSSLGPILALLLLTAALSGCESSPRELSGTYQGTVNENTISVTFNEGHTLRMFGRTSFDGIYTIEDNTIRADFGWGKVNFQIVDENTLRAHIDEADVDLKKQ